MHALGHRNPSRISVLCWQVCSSLADRHIRILIWTADTLYIMAGLGLVDCVDEHFHANEITRHMVDMPSAQHGAMHLLVSLP